ncbi:hypothetical protein HMPREF9225_0458 [Peptoniphilus duerdenii ATCC BAA-1640]|uniref:Uncharacterized protein n=1 Tax=Peptoniphilus duerdenii ATCC BAA-1640 TaxID=862517 RepID=E0NJW9_9FIRM|nr:hypothetical protein HMPREF9225_0458 [Peptoniphilus duerdenii ATCC BAA-1640]
MRERFLFKILLKIEMIVLRNMREEILLKNLMYVPRSMKGGTKWT